MINNNRQLKQLLMNIDFLSECDFEVNRRLKIKST
ncbi:MAG: hypothetical protein ACJAV1_003630, partial [Paraglaciecola sp.]